MTRRNILIRAGAGLVLLLGLDPAAAQVELVSSGAVWRYLDDGSNQGTGWRDPAFDDSGWSSGPAQLGYGDGDEVTVVSFGSDDLNKQATTYFRHAFEVVDPTAFDRLALEVLRDDAAVVYLNGIEVWRSGNLPAGEVPFDAYATAKATEGAWDSVEIGGEGLLAGTNHLAVEIHQESGNSSDVSFDLRLSELPPPPPPPGDELVSLGATWRFLDTGTALDDSDTVAGAPGFDATSWKHPNFDDTAWGEGPAQLGYGDGDEATVVGYGGNASAKFTTTYFRTTFQVADPSTIVGLELGVVRDDGAVVYLNGTEIWRGNLTAGTVTAATTAISAIGGADESAVNTGSVDPGLLAAGDNVIAVEVHQANATSSDISFDLRLAEVVPPAPGLVRGPYLQLATHEGVSVRWRTNVGTDSVVRFGAAPDALDQEVTVPGFRTEHEVRLAGLLPESRYWYSIGSSDTVFSAGSEFYVDTHPPVGARRPTRVWVLGDSGTGDANQVAVRNAFVGFNGEAHADVVLMLGDNAYNDGTDAEFQAGLFDIYPDTIRNSVLWPTLGNHDGHSADSATQSGPYYDMFTLPTGGEAGGVASGTEAYYSFDYGNIHFVCLDSYETPRGDADAMASWLRADLGATIQEWIVVYWHHPPYSKGSHDSDSATASGGILKEMREIFVPILEEFGVDLVLSGHAHSYQRSFLIDGHHGTSGTLAASMIIDGGDGDPLGDGAYEKSLEPHAGAIYTVAGSSGKVDGAAFTPHPIMVRSLLELGSMVLDIDGDEMTATFVNSTGAVRDTFVIRHPTSQPNQPPVLEANALSVSEGETVVLTAAELAASDPDDPAGSLGFMVSGVTHGQFLLDGSPATSFVQEDVAAGRVAFQHDGGEVAPTYAVAVSDGELTVGPEAAVVGFTAVNDPPMLTANGLAVTEGARVVLASADLAAVDVDSPAETLVFSVSGMVGGEFLVNEAAATSFTQAEVAGGLVEFRDFGSGAAPAYFVAVSDGADVTVPEDATIAFTPVNDPPVVVVGALAVVEGQVVPVGGSVVAASDEESGAVELVVTASGVTGGGFRLSGAPATSFTQADVDAGLVEFAADGGETAPAFAFSVTDPDGAEAGPVPGQVEFTTVNDVPVVVANGFAVSEGGTVVLGPTNLAAMDEETSDPALLAWSVTGVAGGRFLVAGIEASGFTQAEVNGGTVAFEHDGSESEPGYAVTIVDEGGATAGPTAGAVDFTAVNDAPVLAANNLVIDENQTVVLTPVNLWADDPDTADDALTFTVANVVGGRFVVGAAAGATTFTQAEIGSGSVAFEHDGTDTEPAYVVTVGDGEASFGPAAAAVSFTTVNDDPELVNNSVTIEEGATVVLTGDHLSAVDEETIDPSALTIVVSGVSSSAEFLLDGAPLGAGSFSMADVGAGRVSLRHDGSEVPPAYSVTVEDPDGGSAGPSSAVVTFIGVHDPVVVRGPYLQSAGSDRMVVCWRTDQPTDSVVTFGTDPQVLDQSVTDPEPLLDHAVTVTGLAAGSRYYYAVGDSVIELSAGPDHYFDTHPDAGTAVPVRLWAVGNTGDSAIEAAAVRAGFVAANGGTAQVDAVLLLGGNAAASGGDAAYDALFTAMGGTVRSSVLWPTIGRSEADGLDAGTGAFPYEDLFVLPTNGESGGAASASERFYSFDLANVHVVCLDSSTSERGAGAAMQTWLRDDLGATSQEWIIAFFHDPPYSKGTVDSDADVAATEMRSMLLPVLEEYGVDLVVSGRSRAWERSMLVDGHHGTSDSFDAGTMALDSGDGDPAGDGGYVKAPMPNDGAVHVVAGNGGGAAAGLAFGHPAIVRAVASAGSLVVDIDGNQLDARFVDGGGDVLDTFRIRHEAPPAEVDLIIDNADPEFSRSGKWTTSTSASGFQGIDYLVDAGNRKAQSASWTPSIPQGGVYLVSMWWPEDPGHAATAPVDVVHADGVERIIVAQNAAGGQWVPLGLFRFTVGSDGALGSVILHTEDPDTGADPGGVVVADAVRFTLESGGGGPDTTPPTPPSGVAATGGDGSVTVDWADNPEADLGSYTVRRAATAGGPYGVLAANVVVSEYVDSDVVNGTTYHYVVTASDLDDNESGFSSEVSATPNAVAERLVHVDSIGVVAITSRRNATGEATIRVMDDTGQPVEGVTVTGDWSLDGSPIGSAAGVTDGLGFAVLSSSRERASSGTFAIGNVTLTGTGFVHDTGADVVQGGSAGF